MNFDMIGRNRAATSRECSTALRSINEDENAMWGRPPGLQADALVGLVGVPAEFEKRDQGVPRRPGGLPHNGGSDFQGSGSVVSYLNSYTRNILGSGTGPVR